MDERFIMHRLYATRLAAIVGAVLLGGWYFYLISQIRVLLSFVVY